ncbi:MAG TPA: hypothetical protein VHA53_12420 [Nitrolancea sp.]|nr:hypothetical protein [Nitrolancea sp.]
MTGSLLALAILLIPAACFAWFGGLVAANAVTPGSWDSPALVYLTIGFVAALVASVFSLGAALALRLMTGWRGLRPRQVWLFSVLVPFVIGVVTAFLFSN